MADPCPTCAAAGVTLRAHFEALLASRDEAVAKAEAAMNRRLDGMNEFRDTLRDQASRFVTTDVLNVRFDTVMQKVWSLERFRDNLDGRILAWGSIFVVLNLILGIAGIGVALWARR